MEDPWGIGCGEGPERAIHQKKKTVKNTQKSVKWGKSLKIGNFYFD